MEREKVEAAVKRALLGAEWSDEIDAKRITREARLVEDLNLDSLDIIDLSMELEIALNIEIANKTVSQWRTVGDVIDTIAAEGASRC